MLCIDKCGFPYARVSCQQGDVALKAFFECIDAFAPQSRYPEAGIAYLRVQLRQGIQVTQVIGVVGVYFVEYKIYGDTIGLGRSQETVDEGGGGFRVVDGNYQHTLVKVGSQDVRLFREVGCAPYDVVAAVFNLGDESSPFAVEHDLHTVAHRYGVGAAYAFQAEVAFHLTFHAPALVGFHQVPASCIFYDQPPHSPK